MARQLLVVFVENYGDKSTSELKRLPESLIDSSS
jgi:hypothetical protein